MHNTHTLWKTIHGKSHRAPLTTHNNSITLNNKISNTTKHIRKLLHRNIPGIIIKLISNYIKGCKAYTTYINHTSRQRQFKIVVPQGGVLSPTLFNIYTSDLSPPSAPAHVMACANDITITSTHTSTSATNDYIQPYIHKQISWTKQSHTKSRQNNLHSVHARPCRIYEQSGTINTQQCTTHCKLRPITHIHHTHPQHLSTRTQTSINHKSTHCNIMR